MNSAKQRSATSAAMWARIAEIKATLFKRRGESHAEISYLLRHVERLERLAEARQRKIVGLLRENHRLRGGEFGTEMLRAEEAENATHG